jgi:subtilisin family serine protease
VSAVELSQTIDNPFVFSPFYKFGISGFLVHILNWGCSENNITSFITYFKLFSRTNSFFNRYLNIDGGNGMMTKKIIFLTLIVCCFFANLSFASARYKSDRIIVRLSDDKTSAGDSAKSQMLGAIGGSSIESEFKVVPGMVALKLPPGVNVIDAVNKLNAAQGVLYAQPDYEMDVLSTVPDDPKFNDLWGMYNTGAGGGKSRADIHAPEAWDLNTGSDDIIVAVIDTGVDYTHPDLAPNMWVNETEKNGTPGVDDDNNGYVDDIYGYDFCNNDGNPMDDFFHGTHCAGTIGAVGNNNTGVAGVCWNVKIMALKFLSSGGSGYTSNAIKCVEYAKKMGAKLSSNSWGGGGYSQALKDAIDAAGEQGMLFVAAAGNAGTNNDTQPTYPGSYTSDCIISVMATDKTDSKASFSCYGHNSVDIGAPGVNILSTFPTYMTSAMTGYGLPTYYGTISGTSMATPHVAGACALIWSRNPSLTGAEVKDILLKSVDKIPAFSSLCVSQGRLNVYNALLSVTGQTHVNIVKERYSCSDQMEIKLIDNDLIGQAGQNVTVSTDGGDSETLTLDATEPNNPVGIFEGTISTTGDPVAIGDGVLQVADGQTVTAAYQDVNDSNGYPATLTDTASVDCTEPVISNVSIDVSVCSTVITFETDEPAIAVLKCDRQGCDLDDYEIVIEESGLATSHSIEITDELLAETDYYFRIEATDDVNNTVIDNNDGSCFSFHTPASPFTGSGTQADPYQVSTAEQMNSIGLYPCKWNKYFKLMADLNLSAYTGQQFNIIGDYAETEPFTGVFDGNGHKISNFTYNSSGVDDASLFAYVKTPGQIKNLGLINVNVSGDGWDAAALVAYNVGGAITNCYATGTVTGTAYDTGGLVGYNSYGNINYCYSLVTVNVTSPARAGGLVGTTAGGTIKNSYAKGAVKGANTCGGLTGANFFTAVTNSYATGTVTGNNYIGGLIGYSYYAANANSYATGAVTGNDYVGGLIGYSDNGSIIYSWASSAVKGRHFVGGLVGYDYKTITTKCRATGAVTATGFYAGGLIGYAYSAATSNSYASGKVAGQYYAAGLAGYIYSGSITNCYAAGKVAGKANYTGGLIALNSYGKFTSSYWDKQTSGQAKSAGGTGLTTIYMKRKASYKSWDFLKIWTIKDRYTYPALR